MGKLLMDYIGYKSIKDDNPILPNLYSDRNTNWFDLYENQYLIIEDNNGQAVDKFKWQDGKYKSVFSKPIESVALGKIKAKNSEQQLAIDLLMDENTTVKVLTGVFGSGKDFLMASCAFKMLQDGKFDRIVWLRNNIEVKDTTSLGYLPGTYDEKLMPFTMPLADHVGGIDALSLYMQRGMIEPLHLGYIRGRDIKNAIVYCSEAEHLTTSHVKLILGRMGEGSILFMNGDFRQIDAKVFEQDNGLFNAIDRLRGNKLFGYINLKETVRSETAKLADLLD